MGNERTEKTQAIAEIKERVQLAEWQRQIEERQSEGLGVAAWCERQGISQSTYYYRLRKIREYLCQKPWSSPPERSLPGQLPENRTEAMKEECRGVPIRTTVSAPSERKVEIRLGELSVSFTGEASPEALRAVVEALRSC